MKIDLKSTEGLLDILEKNKLKFKSFGKQKFN